MSSETGIRQLPPDVVAKIKSSTSITHLNGVIVELAKNSLDANAHTVLVSVDFKRGSCIVEDDGEGIPPVEFESGGGLGKAHRMSCHFLHIWSRAHKSLRYIEIPEDRGIWPSRPILGLPCFFVLADRDITPHAESEYKFGHFSSFKARCTLAPCTVTSMSPGW
jgi:hypothetical protein